MDPRRHALSLTLLLCFAPCAPRAAAVPAEDPAAISVDSLLRVLQAQGIDVIYSSELVPPQMRAPAPRPGRTPLEAATDALAANGLKLEPLAPHLILVHRRSEARENRVPVMAGVVDRHVPLRDRHLLAHRDVEGIRE